MERRGSTIAVPSVISSSRDCACRPWRCRAKAQVVDEPGVQQAPHRQVHRDDQVQALAPPERALEERVIEHVLQERPDETGLLGRGDESIRPQQPVARVLPADEGLHAIDVPRADLDLWLEVDDEVAVLDRLAQLPDQQRRERISGLQIDSVPCCALGSHLGHRQSHVRSHQGKRRFRAVLGEDERAHASLDRDAQVGQLERALQCLADAHCRAAGFFAGGDGRVQDAEGVAAHPRHQRLFAGQHFQASADCVQNRVSRLVSQKCC